MFSKENRGSLSLVLLSILLLSIILIANIKRAMNGEFFAYDYGIYQQGIFELAKGNLNPFMSIRDIKLWNDHFMPIILLAVPWVWIWDFSTSALAIFEWGWFVLAAAIGYRLTRENSFAVRLSSLVFILFAKGILSGLHFAIHPGVWSAPVWLLLGYAISRRDWDKSLLYAFCLLFFRESFSFSVLSFTGVLILLGKSRKKASILFLVTLAFALFVFVLREHFLGGVEDFGGGLVKGLVSSPVAFIVAAFYEFDWKVFLKIIYPFFIPLVMILSWKTKENKNEYLSFLALVFPHFFLHFLANRFHYQYGVAAVAPLLGFIIGSKILERTLLRNKVLFTIITVLPILSGMSYYTKFTKKIFQTYRNGSYIFSNVYKEKDVVRRLLLDIPKDKKIIGPSRTTATLYRPGMTNLYTVEAFLKRDKKYDFLFYWKEQDYVFQGKRVAKKSIMDQFCSKSIEDIIYESDVFYLAKGSFDKDCYELNYP